MNFTFCSLRWLGWVVAALTLLMPIRSQSPSAPPQLSEADLEKLLGPIALYPDPLLSIMLPAACFPLEIVEAARFVANTNNIPKIDDQSWDTNVKGVAKIPAALKKLNDDLTWTSNLGQAFLDQQKDVMDTIQVLRNRATSVGTLKTSEQQIVIVTNMLVEKTVETKVVVVTNTIVQIEPANPQIVYVPQYVPSAVYYPPPTYNPLTPLITFGVGVAVGAIVANNCNWHYGGVYVGGGWGYHGGGNYYGGNNNININVNNHTINNIGNNNRPGNQPTPWKPDSSRLRTAGAPGAAQNYQSREARGWGSSSGGSSALGSGDSTRPASQTFPGGNTRPSTQPSAGNRPNTAATRPSQGSTRPSPSAAPPQRSPAPNTSYDRPQFRSDFSAFGGMDSGSTTRAQSQRGAVSRGGGGGGRRR